LQPETLVSPRIARQKPAQQSEENYLRRLGERVRETRARRGMTRKILARDSDVSERYLAQLESGQGNISIILLRQVAHAMGVNLADLVREEADPPIELTMLVQFLSRLAPHDLARAHQMLAEGLAPKQHARRIALIGLRGAGKSSLGEAAAAKLGMPFVELDREIERESGMSLAELFDLYGQPAYRRHERRCLESVIRNHERAIIAAGGSLVSEPGTFELLLSACFTVWVKASPEEHMNRVIAQGDMRPMADNVEAMDDLRKILATRTKLYGRADVVIDTSGRSVKDSVSQLVALVDAKPSNHRKPAMITFETTPERYRHWKLNFDGPVATLALDVDETGGIQPGYTLKLNSYDLGVDIELHDALQRIRFEHPEVRSVVLTSAKDRIFCSGANIFMLGKSSHAWKVNFCKFTNETRNGIEDSSAHSGLKFIAACNGTTAGGGYEVALACDEIILIDDSSSAVSLPEVPLLGVLPGTGGLTRVTDKRKVRRDLADIFCTTTEGVRGKRAKEWRLVDEVVKPKDFAAHVRKRALELAATSDRPQDAKGVALTPLRRMIDDQGYHYEFIDVAIDPATRRATLTVKAPQAAQPEDIHGILALGAAWWPLQMGRELDDAILMLRTNNLDIGTWLLKSQGDAASVLAVDAALAQHSANWFVRETIGLLRRTLARLDVSSRTLIALIEQGSAFAGTLLELALAADRTYMLDLQDDGPRLALSELNFGAYPRVDGLSRIESRFYREAEPVGAARAAIGRKLAAREAAALGLITAALDDIDWSDEIRVVLEERASMSPDALTGMEANLRFGAAETMETRVFGRLSAWQNWIFIRPNAVGETGALKVFGSGTKAKFDWERV
jgi:benzoyl-CoA-dihydrodiol lyase